MQSTAKKLKLAPEKLIVTVDRHGNTSAASIPARARRRRPRRQDQARRHVMLEGVGGGFTWGATLFDF
jgi:3-oxoacyl-[acyl-carrier-protein] synthase-3